MPKSPYIPPAIKKDSGIPGLERVFQDRSDIVFVLEQMNSLAGNGKAINGGRIFACPMNGEGCNHAKI